MANSQQILSFSTSSMANKWENISSSSSNKVKKKVSNPLHFSIIGHLGNNNNNNYVLTWQHGTQDENETTEKVKNIENQHKKISHQNFN